MRGLGDLQPIMQAGIFVGQSAGDGEEAFDPLAEVQQFLFHPAMLGSGFGGVKSAGMSDWMQNGDSPPTRVNFLRRATSNLAVRMPFPMMFSCPLIDSAGSRLARRCLWAAGILLAGLMAAVPAQAAGPVRVEAVEVELVSREAAVVPGGELRLGLRIRHDPHWHSYWRNPGDSGLATEVELVLPPGFAAQPIDWPAPERLFIPPLANYGYEGEIVLPIRVAVPALTGAGPLQIAAKASWLMCKDVCIPGEASLALVLPVSAGPEVQRSRHSALFDAADARMPSARLDAVVSVQGERLSIGWAEPLEAAEFFPYREGLIENAAAQSLHAIEGPEGLARRLQLRLSADGARSVATDPAQLMAAAQGVIVSGKRVFEVNAVRASGIPEGGREIHRVAGAPAEATVPIGGSASRAGGLSLPGFGLSGTAAAGKAGAAGAPAESINLLVAALFAAIGGLILNLMPCVFPVIGLKVLGFAQHGGSGAAADVQAARRASRAGAFAFSAGVVVSFWVLALLLLGLRAAGQAAGWGFQLQSPVFVTAMALLFVAIALNFSGVYEFGMSLTRLGQYDPAARAHAGSPRLASFGSGALAVLVATPCTAPFMGSALGFTLVATTAETLFVFTALGLGMALPYLLLGAFPAWLRILPRPGRWMESFRQALAFPMYATVAWLAWVLGQQAGLDAVFALAIACVLLALAAWLYGRFVQQGGGGAVGPGRRISAGLAAVLTVLVAALIVWPGATTQAPPVLSGQAGVGQAGVAGPAAGLSSDLAVWQPWSAERVDQALAAGRPVFVDFTAAWCVTCQANKKLVLERAAVVEAMNQAGMVRLRADWTNEDPAITAELARHGRNGVPLYLVFRPGADRPVVLPELLTISLVVEAVAAAR
jgi:thiol:disulfide interchange protein/DsbC/DsbD-like thiol-disulfide interchange protein